MQAGTKAPEFMSRVDGALVTAAQIRMVDLYPSSGRMILRFVEDGIPRMITSADAYGVPAPGSWLIWQPDGRITYKCDLEFRSEFRPMTG